MGRARLTAVLLATCVLGLATAALPEDETRTCSETEFKCANGRCIPVHWQCDNEKDCSDGSDEDSSTCQKKVCSPEEFTCRAMPGECVPLTWMCDDNPDCSDGSDEKACSKPTLINTASTNAACSHSLVSSKLISCRTVNGGRL